ncbi:type II toxin-antitoxin system VapB family antitoxin [Streptomyces bambusae]|uniref:Type II toxin-antitoxin system VapB family antitoxin n=1 Tax=Streptomyces bambusae TaxID=1550616 RepID=A0ABS6Z6T2_9ACTN|nr:type II toxin-antitoxin system VapB family antitoxin [Streptomyces bambusae]MBW5483473.1 type II toxin-antitoxin system VapB family antitoxin [Streptomyces bambusae]
MSMTNVDLDDDVLAEAMRLMGTRTKKDTINGALLDYVQRIKRLQALEELGRRAAQGEFDDAIKAYEARKRAWRGAA